MSNWSRAKVTFKKMDSALLSDALKAMGYYPNFNDKKVDGSYSFDGSRECDCVLYDINTDQTSNIGLSFTTDKDDNIDIKVIGDWYNKTYNDKTFTQALTLEYSTANMIKQARENGYMVQETEMIEEYKRRVVFVKAA